MALRLQRGNSLLERNSSVVNLCGLEVQMNRQQTLKTMEIYLLTCRLKRMGGLGKLETRPDPRIRYELLLVTTSFHQRTSAQLGSAALCVPSWMARITSSDLLGSIRLAIGVHMSASSQSLHQFPGFPVHRHR
jgi:hypothetical protein